MRSDDIGMFWEDHHTKGIAWDRPLAAIPETGWRPPETLPDLSDAKCISIDTETYDPELKQKGPGIRRDGYIVGLAVGLPTGERWYLPMRHKLGGNLNPEQVINWAKINLTRPNQPKLGANLLYDLDYLEQEGVKVVGPFHDVQIAEPLIDENRLTYNLDEIGLTYLKEGKKDQALYEWASKSYGGKVTREDQASNIWRSPVQLVGPYAEGDVDLPLRIFEHQEKELKAQNLSELFTMESELMPMVLAMRRRGVRVNVAAAEEFMGTATQEVKRLTKELGGINVNAAEDLVRLCKKERIDYPKTDKGNPSFRKDWLKNHPHPAMRRVTEIRTLIKLRDTFVKGYILGCNINGRIHCSFNQLRSDDSGTVSGRFSSSDPNLQNIPTRTPMGKAIRAMFLPEEDETWERFDWSQIEYRLLTHYAMGRGAESARQMYRDNPDTDFHQMVCDMVNRIAYVDRGSAKNINFGLCIAEGQRVLTDSGWIPIESITLANRVWDGVSWVNHSGLIYKGIKEVSEYEGLTATADHIIYTERFGALPFGRCASERKEIIRESRRRTFLDGFRFPDNYKGLDNSPSDKERQSCAGIVQYLQTNISGICRQYFITKDDRVQVSTNRKKKKMEGNPSGYNKDLGRQVRCNNTEVQYRYPCFLRKLQRAWNSMSVQIKRTIYFLGSGEISGMELQGHGFRQREQQRALRTEQSSTCDEIYKSPKQKKMKVYDLLNAGPNHRFLCEEVLVSNCYGMGEELLASILGKTPEEARSLIESYHEGVPFVRYTYNMASKRAQQRHFIRTILGRRRRFPEGQFTHKALNSLLQGGNADIMKRAMVDIWKSGVIDVLGAPLLTVHDELDWSKPRTKAAEEAMREVHHIMENCVKISVPIIAARESGPDWGHLIKVQR